MRTQVTEKAALAYDLAAREHAPGRATNYESVEAAQAAAAQSKPAPRARPKSGYYGVRSDGKKWQARINYNGKKFNLGSFVTKEQAALAYDQAARVHTPEKPTNYTTLEEAQQAADRAEAGLLLFLDHRVGIPI